MSHPHIARLRLRSVGTTVSVLALLAVTACTDSGADDNPSAASSEELATFYDQDLEFSSCEGLAPTSVEEPYFVDPFECAQMTVPLDYADPDGDTAEIGVLRMAATGEASERIGSMVINPGGPGGSGMTQAAVSSALLKDSPIAQRFDFVGFDPRGVGTSTPAINCFTDEERDNGENQTTLLGSAGEWDDDDTRSLKEKCSEGSGGDDVLASVGTRNVARDMDVLREMLGEEKLTFSGQSYGTRLGAVYAEMFPENLRAMVLDGIIDPAQATAERRLALHAGFQRSFDLMAASCAENADCPLGADPDQASQEYQNLMQPLIDERVPAGPGRTAGHMEATGGVTGGLYYSEQWPAIIEGITQLKEDGRADKLLSMSDQLGVRAEDGQWNSQLDANLAINCNDEQRRTPEEEAALRADIAEVNPASDIGTSFEGVTRDACEFWPGEPSLGFPYAQGIEGLPEPWSSPSPATP